MNQRILFVMPDNSVQVSHVSPKATRKDAIAMPADAVGGPYLVSVEDLPDEHREAWVWNGNKVIIDPSRIKPPKAVRDAVQSLPGREIDLSPLFEQMERMRAEVTAQVAAISENLLRYGVEINIAMNALKSDQEASDDKVGMVREQCRRILGDQWQERAQQIVAQHDADALRLMGVS